MAEAGKGAWDARELEELRAREAGYRERLALQAELAQRLGSYSESLQRVLRGRPPSRAHLSSTLLEVAKLSSSALGIERTSIWLFDPEHRFLRCNTLLRNGEVQDVRGVEIDVSTCPQYVAALSEAHALAVGDVTTDARTRELAPYLSPNDVGALLDIPIVIPGALLGVVCHEHVKGPRVWHREEIDFAANVGSLVALALETERRLTAEYTAQGTEARYRHLVESLPVTVYAFDIHTTKLMYLSPHAVQLSGWTPAQWLQAGADHWIERVHPDDRAAIVARFEPGALSGLPAEIVYRVHMPNGQWRWVRDTCSLVRDPVGRAVALQGVLCDVTEQREAELERQELERRQRFMLDHADLHAVMIDAAGSVTFVNDYFCHATGYTREAVIGRSWFELTTPVTERARLRRDLEQGVTRGHLEPRMEAPLRTAAGERLQVLWTNTLLRDTEGQVEGVLGLGVDMTQRIRLESELVQQTKVESLGRLAAGVAHDFNNLLAVMLAETENLGLQLARLERGEPYPREATQRSQASLRAALQQASDLTHSLLVYGRKQPVRTEAFLLDELVAQTLQLAAAVAGDELDTSIALDATGVHVLLDRLQLRQVILNLVGNAADATRGVGKQIRLRTHVELIDARHGPHPAGDPLEPTRFHRTGLTHSGEYAVLTVEDDGCGMEGPAVTRIFDPFYTTKADGRGTGLGLSMCQSIINRARGFIDVQSAAGSGTSFRVYLPRVSPTGNALESTDTPDSRPAPTQARILVVDDVSSIRTMLETQLREAGYRVFAAATVATAAQILAAQPIDLLLTDGILPDGSGVALARSARSVRPNLKVILASGSIDAESGFDAILLKPFDSAQLLRTVAAVLDEAHILPLAR
ncbi:MAG: PAS domain S-box protein [Polyangiales bacterium]